MNRIKKYFEIISSNSKIKNLEYNENQITFTDNRGEWKITKDENDVCKCKKSSNYKISLDLLTQGFICEQCIKNESEINSDYIFLDYVADFETKEVLIIEK